MKNELMQCLNLTLKLINNTMNIFGISNEDIELLKKYRLEISSYIAYMEILDAQEDVQDDENKLREIRRKTTEVYKSTKDIKERYKVNTQENKQEENETGIIKVNPKTNNTRKVIDVAPIEVVDLDNEKQPKSKINNIDEEEYDVDYSTEYQNKKEKIAKLKKGLKTAIVITLVAGIAFGFGRCTKKNKKENTSDIETKPSTTVSEYIEDTTKEDDNLTIKNLNLDDDDEVKEFVKALKNEYHILANMSDDEIINAIKLANFDKLQNQAVFYSNEEALTATQNAGKIITIAGSDAIMKKDSKDDIYLTETELKNIISVQTKVLSISDFAKAKTNNSYDLIKVIEICIAKVNDNDKNALEYARVANELIADYEISFVICNNSPVSALYVVAGLYDTNRKNITALTSGHGSGPRYGYSENAEANNLDGTYGFICSEEIEDYAKIDGNNDNVLYSNDFVSEKLVKGQSRTR